MACTRIDVCRRDALNDQPNYGMWAGVWVDGDFAAKRHLLTLAVPAVPKPKPRPNIIATQTYSGLCAVQPRRRTRRVGSLLCGRLTPAAAELVTSRASGHCEIMAPACLYQQHAVFSRCESTRTQPADLSPADGLVVCRNCLELIEATDRRTARKLGYLTAAHTDPARVQVYWRQRHWMLLNHFGQLINCDPAPTRRGGHFPQSA